MSRRAFVPVDAASLGIFRIAFGAMLVWEVARYFSYGWIDRYYVDPTFHFTYLGFDWVRPWPGVGMHLHFAALGALGAAIALGLRTRAAAALFCAGFTYVFLLDAAHYLNHFYLIALLAFLLAVVDAGRAFSIDALRRPRPPFVPAWQLWLLRAQVGVVYVYAGIAKLNPDWLGGEPMRSWLAKRTDYAVVGPFLTDESVVHLFALGGLLLDLGVVPLLLWRRTRAAAFAAAVLFHVANEWLFSIGIFPWVMIAATTLFLAPDWPRRLLRRAAPAAPAPFPVSRRTLAWVGLYLAVQILVPLRHHLYPGWVHWTEEGHRFSWRMMLRAKQARGDFVARDADGRRIAFVDPWDELPRWQARTMLRRPDLVQQYARHVAERLRGEGHGDVRVYARVEASLHRRHPQPLVDPEVDLAAQPRGLAPAPWIEPLREYLMVGED